MDKKLEFGELHAKSLDIGDIVEWSRWNSDKNDWDYFYGIILEMKNQFKANRLVSISTVIPLNGATGEMEFFTLSLRPVSHQNEHLENNNESWIYNFYWTYV